MVEELWGRYGLLVTVCRIGINEARVEQLSNNVTVTDKEKEEEN